LVQGANVEAPSVQETERFRAAVWEPAINALCQEHGGENVGRAAHLAANWLHAMGWATGDNLTRCASYPLKAQEELRAHVLCGLVQKGVVEEHALPAPLAAIARALANWRY